MAYGQLEPAMLSLKGIGGSGVDALLSGITKTKDNGFIIRVESSSSAGSGNIDSFCSMGGGRSVFLKYNDGSSEVEWSKCASYEGDSLLIYLFPVNNGHIGWGI